MAGSVLGKVLPKTQNYVLPKTLGLFDPLSLPSLVGLVDWGYPDIETYADGVAVDSTANLVTSANNYTATTTARPTMKRGSNGINNRAAFSFDGSANTLNGAAGLLPLFNNVPGISLLAVVQFATATPGAVESIIHVGVNGVPGSSRASIRCASANNYSVSSRRLDADATSTVSASSNTLTTSPVIMFSVTDFVGGKHRLWVNGTAVTAEASLVSSGGNCSPTDAAIVRLSSLAGASFFGGKLGARSLWNSAVCSTSLATLTGDALTLVRAWGDYYGIVTA